MIPFATILHHLYKNTDNKKKEERQRKSRTHKTSPPYETQTTLTTQSYSIIFQLIIKLNKTIIGGFISISYPLSIPINSHISQTDNERNKNINVKHKLNSSTKTTTTV